MRKEGIVPEALISLMARLGSSQPIELQTELGAVAEGFELSHFGTAPTPGSFPLTARYLQSLPLLVVAQSVAEAGVPETYAEQFWMVVRDNITTLNDLSDWWILCSEGAEPDISDEDREFVSQAVALLPTDPT